MPVRSSQTAARTASSRGRPVLRRHHLEDESRAARRSVVDICMRSHRRREIANDRETETSPTRAVLDGAAQPHEWLPDLVAIGGWDARTGIVDPQANDLALVPRAYGHLLPGRTVFRGVVEHVDQNL